MGSRFGTAEFERAFASFRQMYQTRPSAVYCSPDVLERYSEVYGRAGDWQTRELRYEGIRVLAAVMPPGTIAFEGDVDEDRMGDW